ncbi:NAD-dependent epimerase/dehydratase family protein [Ligilactobacillus saerimneri]|uniref:NAD-dependent epimerase/dehydratase family protein n=1 Tax=Ligilactobacillus saerimneri TaxID=228229 RepID=UPI000400E02F|nr:NAD-dependent epimerase/dehydratase family protein [Ligilactobacillus saerimneri]KRL71924.1 UDP-glucose 4-epimerase [Ligilactobacillus saerimneri DSM 16049]
MTKVLVTGGAGFIGSNLVIELVNKGYQVTVIDDLSMGIKANLTEVWDKITFYEHDVCDHAFMHQILDENFDYIYYLAAVSSVADSVVRPYETHQVNLESVVDTLEYLRVRDLHPKKFLFTSSAAVYGNYPELPKREDSRVQPLTPYAIDKYAAERYTIDYGTLYGLKTVAVRFFNVFGPRQNPNSPYSGVLSIVTKCLLDDEGFTLYGDGSQTRDFIYVKDIVNALIFISEKQESNDVYNIGYGHQTALLDVIRQYERVAGKDLEITFADRRAGDIAESLADVARLTELGFKPQWGLEKGLEEYWEYIKQ